jgi:hypothetical protein
MNTPAFFRGAFRAVFVLLVAGLLAACAPPVGPGGEGNLKIILAGGSMSRALDPETEAALSYTLDFSGPGGESLSRTAGPGSSSLTLFLSPGKWTIRAEAFLDGELYGTGETSVTVKDRKTNEAMIVMQRVDPDDDSGDWYMTVYVALGGSGDGSETSPFGTVAQALSAIEDAYGEGDWPKDGDTPVPARILISGSITEAGSANGMVDITDTVLHATYPPIILAGKGTGADVGTLDANNAKRVLNINKANVTLGANLTLTRGKITAAAAGAGVRIVAGSTFTMTGGTISHNEATGPGTYEVSGGGVYAGGDFIMTGGTISNNTATSTSNYYGTGGGVYATGNFTMTGGTIRQNHATGPTSGGYGGGVYFNGSGTIFTMSGGTIGGSEAAHENTAKSGGGVYIRSGSFVMNAGAVISNNTASLSGGGVSVANDITFTMNGGTISDNKAVNPSDNGEGGGVYAGGTFNMKGGTISSNTAQSTASGYSGNGGGVYASGDFTMDSGTISKNHAIGPLNQGFGGGVYFKGNSYKTFTMNGGIIGGSEAADGNTAQYSGGGVYIAERNFEMHAGTISNNQANTANGDGGGVGLGGSSCSFTMDGEDAVISGNTAAHVGGGVYIGIGTFTKTGGTIYGANEGDVALKNTAGTDGHAAYLYNAGAPSKRNTTAGPDSTGDLDSSNPTPSGGWDP